MPFPENPNDGDAYGDYYYDASEGGWRKAGTVNNINIDDIINKDEDEFDIPPVTSRVLDIEGGTIEFSDGSSPSLKEVQLVPGTFGNSVHWDYAFMRQVPYEPVNDLIQNGNCESLTPPSYVGNTGLAGSATFARTDEQVFEGDYSYKLTANSTCSQWYLTDVIDDYQGLDPGEIIRFEAMVYVPTQSGSTPSQFITALRMRFSGASRYLVADTLQFDRWEKLVIYFQVPYYTQFDGWTPYLQICGVPSAGYYMYVDNIRIWKLEHSRPSIYIERQMNSSFENRYQDVEGNFWNHNSSYETNPRVEYDEEIDAPVFVWNKGSNSNDTFLYQATGQSLGADAWTMSFWYKCNYPTRTRSYVYGPNTAGAYNLYPANKWVRVNNYVGTASTGTGFQLSNIQLWSATAFPTDIEFRVTEPFVNSNEFSNGLKLPYVTTQASCPLQLDEDFPQVGTFMCWLKPGFTVARGGNVAILGDYNPGSRYIYFFYSQTEDKFRVDLGTQTTLLESPVYIYNGEIQQWTHIAFTWDVINDEYALYWNGRVIDTSTADTGAYDPKGILSIGGLTQITAPTAYYISSAMADILFDTTVLDTQTIRDHYNSGVPWLYKPRDFIFKRIYRENGEPKEILYNQANIGGRQWHSH